MTGELDARPADPAGTAVPGAAPETALETALEAALEGELDAAVALRRAVHRDPRLSGDEADTRDAVLDALADLPEVAGAEPVAGTGTMLRLGGGAAPIAIRGELDALPVVERTGLPFAAGGAVAHVCGHDVHLAALVAVTRAVSRAGPEQLPAPLLAVFQPREESAPSGAADVAASRAFLAHAPAAMLGLHVQPELERGVVSARGGAVNASADEVDVVVTGRAGHGGYPHRTADPVVALSAIVVAAQHVVSRRTDPMRAGVVTFGQLLAGSAPNVVPETATARGTVRALDADRDALLAALREVAEHTAAAHGCRAEVTVVPNEPAVVNHDTLAASVARGLERRGSVVLDTTFRSCGADDFAHYGAVLPSLMLFVGASAPGTAPGSAPGLHHPAFSPDDAMVGEIARAMLTALVAAGATAARAPTGTGTPGPPTPPAAPPIPDEEP